MDQEDMLLNLIHGESLEMSRNSAGLPCLEMSRNSLRYFKGSHGRAVEGHNVLFGRMNSTTVNNYLVFVRLDSHYQIREF